MNGKLSDGVGDLKREIVLKLSNFAVIDGLNYLKFDDLNAIIKSIFWIPSVFLDNSEISTKKFQLSTLNQPNELIHQQWDH